MLFIISTLVETLNYDDTHKLSPEKLSDSLLQGHCIDESPNTELYLAARDRGGKKTDFIVVASMSFSPLLKKIDRFLFHLS